MGARQSNEDFVRESATRKFDKDRARLSKVRRSQRGPQDPRRRNYDYIPHMPTKYDVAPSVPFFINPALFKIDREYSNKPPYLYAYDKRLFRRQPNVFPFDPDYSTTTYRPPDPSLAYTDPEYTPYDLDTLNRYRSPWRASENPYGELTSPLTTPLPHQIPHRNPDPYNVHFLDARGFMKPRKT